MNFYGTLIFPDTDIFHEKFYPLLLFFTPLHFLQPIESGSANTDSQQAELFLQRGLCQAHTPAPLGENRPQFLRLIDDIRKRREHYFTLLKTTSTSLKTASQDTGKVDIVSSMLQEFGITHQRTGTDLSLWRARLILAMAEIQNSDQEDVRDEYSRQLDDFNEEITALRSLPEAEGTDEVELLHQLEDVMAQLEKPRFKDSINRVEAWLRLLKNQPLPSVKVWVATSRDSGEQFFTRYESISNTSAVPILKLAFPAYIDASVEYVIEYIQKFQNNTIKIHRGLVADFERTVKTVPYLRDSPESLLPYGIDWAEQWEEKLDEYFPARRDGRSYVTFYLFPGQPIDQLLSLPTSDSPDQAVHGLLGILGPS